MLAFHFSWAVPMVDLLVLADDGVLPYFVCVALVQFIGDGLLAPKVWMYTSRRSSH